jgi:hypothetical protein
MAEYNGEELRLYLKERDPYGQNVYLEINMWSKTFIKTKEYKLKLCKITGAFDKEKFQLVNSVYAKQVKFSEVEKWDYDKKQPDRKIDLYLKRDIFFPNSFTWVNLSPFSQWYKPSQILRISKRF